MTLPEEKRSLKTRHDHRGQPADKARVDFKKDVLAGLEIVVELDPPDSLPVQSLEQLDGVGHKPLMMAAHALHSHAPGQRHVMLTDVVAHHERFTTVHEDLDVVFYTRMVFLHNHVVSEILHLLIEFAELLSCLGISSLPWCLFALDVLFPRSQDQRKTQGVSVAVCHKPVESHAARDRNAKLGAEGLHVVLVCCLVKTLAGRRKQVNIRLKAAAYLNQCIMVAFRNRHNGSDLKLPGQFFDLVSEPGTAWIRLQHPGAGGKGAVGCLAVLRLDNGMDRKPVSSETPHNPQAYLRVADNGEDAAVTVPMV